MRIGINTLFLVPGDVGGTEIYLRRNLLAMVAGNPDDIFVLFATLNNEELFRDELKPFANVDYRVLPFRAAIRPLRILCEQLLLPWFVWESKVDLLWSPGYTAPALCNCPQAVTVHDLQYKSHPDDLSFLERITLDTLVKIACRQCAAIIAVSEFSKQEILRYGFAPSDKIHAVLEGVEPDFATPVPAEETVQLPSADKPYILCVAHTYPHKNVDKLIAAFALLEKRIPYQLVLVGKARRGEQSVQEQLQRLQNPKRVIRLQDLINRELQALYHEATMFVLPSTYEGFGLPVLEAMMAGLPVVTVKAASLPEVGGQYAVYAEKAEPSFLANKVMEVLNLSEQERTEQVRKGRQWAKSFTWERTAEQTVQILRSLISEKEAEKEV